jgi:hypothetical protein
LPRFLIQIQISQSKTCLSHLFPDWPQFSQKHQETLLSLQRQTHFLNVSIAEEDRDACRFLLQRDDHLLPSETNLQVYQSADGDLRRCLDSSLLSMCLSSTQKRTWHYDFLDLLKEPPCYY